MTLLRFVLACSLPGALLISGPAEAADSAAAVQTQFRSSVQIYGGEDKDNGFWFTIWDPSSRFVVDGISPDQAAQLRNVLTTAVEAHRSVELVYEAAKARWNEKDGVIDYPVCSVSFEELSFTPPRKCADGLSGAVNDVNRLAIGYAASRDGSPQAARQMLAPLIAAKKGSPAFRATALRARATALQELAERGPEASRSRDAALALALIDSRAVAVALPDDINARLAIAYLLKDLGDYSAAEKEFRGIIARWPDEEETVSVALAQVVRTRGDPQASLDILDGVTARHGLQDGMRFNYHRAWSLLLLNRFDEAIAALNAGIERQPDYSWAYVRRACAYASTGRIDGALADMEMAISLIEKLPKPDEKSEALRDRSRLQEIRSMLAKAVAASSHDPMPEACSGFGEYDEKPRTRSALLDERPDVLLREIASLE